MEENQRGVKKKQDFPKLLERVLKFISFRPRSQKEILDYLKKKIPQKPDLQEKIFQEVKDLGLVDDEAFARWWVEQRMTFRPKGKKALFYELKQKGVESSLIEEILAKEIDETTLAYQAGQKKWNSLKNLPPEVGREKLVGFLSRRGFSWGAIQTALDEILKKR